MLAQAQEQFIEHFATRGTDLHARIALVGALLANPDLVDLKIAAAGQDRIQHLGQDERIDDVATQLDCLGNHPPMLAQALQPRQFAQPCKAAVRAAFVSDGEGVVHMARMEKPNARGPKPADKAQKALGKKLNRPAKQPPTMPGRKISKNEPLARRVTDEVDDL